MDISKGNFDSFRKDFKDAVKSLEAKYGVKATIGGITYDKDGTHFTSRLTVTNHRVDGIDVGQLQFNQHCDRYGFKSSDYNREFTVRGQRLKLVGFNPKAPKNPCKIEDVATGGKYKCSKSYVQNAF